MSVSRNRNYGLKVVKKTEDNFYPTSFPWSVIYPETRLIYTVNKTLFKCCVIACLNFFFSVIGEEDEERKEDKMHGNSEQDSEQLVSKDHALEDKTPNR